MKRVGGGHRSRLGSGPASRSFTIEQIERMPTFGPDCPRCSAITVQRDRKDGTGSFWGCRNYPRCKGTIPLE